MTYEEYLQENGKLIYRNVGTSMLPLLKQGRDLFIVEPLNGKRPRKYDVILYRRPPSEYVLHRVIKVRKEDYVILGDNCLNREYGICDGDVLGIMTGYVRKGKQRSCESLTYKAYSHIWVWLYPVRALWMRMKAWMINRIRAKGI